MSQLEFDESIARQLEVLYATRDVLRRRQLVRDALDVAPGERVMDVGCGPGFYVAELLEDVGSNGSVVGIDISQAMLAVAAHRSEGHDNVSFHEADATSLPVENASFDAVLSVQVLENFGRDGISEDEASAWEAEQRELAQRNEFFFACIQFCFTATRPG
jgi:arsenite methyltransferase